MNEDPTPELFAILDESKLNAGALFDSKRSMSALVSEIRGKIVQKTAAYIARRERELKRRYDHD